MHDPAVEKPVGGGDGGGTGGGEGGGGEGGGGNGGDGGSLSRQSLKPFQSPLYVPEFGRIKSVVHVKSPLGVCTSPSASPDSEMSLSLTVR